MCSFKNKCLKSQHKYCQWTGLSYEAISIQDPCIPYINYLYKKERVLQSLQTDIPDVIEVFTIVFHPTVRNTAHKYFQIFPHLQQ